MKRIITLVAVVGSLLAACKKMSYFQTNPNAPSTAISSSLLTSLEKNLFATSPVSSNGTNEDAFFDMSTVLQFNVGFANHSIFSQSYQWVTTSMNEYLQISDAQAMIDAPGSNDGYKAIAKLFMAIQYYSLTNKFGDVPGSQANQLVAGITKPVYDSQKKVYQMILANLDTANNLLASADDVVQGDFIYNGSLARWRKFVNSFRLRVIMSLSNKTTDSELNPGVLFAEIMNNPEKYPVFGSNNDNAQQITNTITPTPFYNNPAYVYYGLAEAFADSLILFQDPRLVHWAAITPDAVAAGKSIYDYTAYNGLPADATNANNTARQSEASTPNPNYFYQANYEPNLFLGFYEVSFAIAEGIARNWWSSADAETYYKKGITASLAFYDIPLDTIQRYVASPNVAYNSSRGLQQILFQRYIASVYNSGFEPYYTQRRTGYPVMAVSGDGIPGHQQPFRWQYPVSEYTLNKDNVAAAVQSQYPGGDIIAEKMWLLKP
ncbi:MAG: SusD/RagB family nutrient-binding outer membrane lipoprotein [Chitinophagaceae bacterium]|nr:SusD/RagB family nutrient-binding outer membrane lipoprotein [Chitinophagaceae bacterium]